MIGFIKNEYPGYCALITFYQFVKQMNMSFNEFNNLVRPMTNGVIRRLWDDIFTGKVSYEELKREFFKNDSFMYKNVDEFVKVLYRLQTGMDADTLMDMTEDYDKDVHFWNKDCIENFFDLAGQGVLGNEVPFVTEVFPFEKKKFKKPEHVFITSMERLPSGEYRIRQYDSDENFVEDYISKDPYIPLIYGKSVNPAKIPEGEKIPFKEAKAGNIETKPKKKKDKK